MGHEIKRKFSLSVYAIGLIYTLIVISIGFVAGMAYDNYAYQEVRNEISEISESASTMQIISAVYGTEDFCKIYPKISSELEEQTWKLGEKLQYMEENNKIDLDLKKRYFDLELRDYFLFKKASNDCNINSPVILYFYTNSEEKKCNDCARQGSELTFAREELKADGILIKAYSFDGEINHDILEFIKNKYAIKNYPSIVIEKNNKFTLLNGLTEKSAIINEIEK